MKQGDYSCRASTSARQLKHHHLNALEVTNNYGLLARNIRSPCCKFVGFADSRIGVRGSLLFWANRPNSTAGDLNLSIPAQRAFHVQLGPADLVGLPAVVAVKVSGFPSSVTYPKTQSLARSRAAYIARVSPRPCTVIYMNPTILGL